MHVNHGIRGKHCRIRKTEDLQKRENPVLRIVMMCLSVSRMEDGTEEGEGRSEGQHSKRKKEMHTSSDGDIRIALAHNKNDVAETMLHHLARGRNRGMAALKPVNGEFIRPVICLERMKLSII